MLVRVNRHLHPVHFLLLTRQIASRVFGRKSIPTSYKDFLGNFGVSPTVCSDVWRRANFKNGTQPIHILWALLFLFTYLTETLLCSLIGTARMTFRKWAWPVVQSISALGPDVVSFDKDPSPPPLSSSI
jgi:hypothetical protein